MNLNIYFVTDVEPRDENVENENVLNGYKPDTRNRRKYFLFFDKRIVFQSETFQQVLKLLLAVYFVFNQIYPKAQGTTLLFLQIYFLNISSPGTLCRSRQDSFKRKAMTFMRALNKIDLKDHKPI